MSEHRHSPWLDPAALFPAHLPLGIGRSSLRPSPFALASPLSRHLPHSSPLPLKSRSFPLPVSPASPGTPVVSSHASAVRRPPVTPRFPACRPRAHLPSTLDPRPILVHDTSFPRPSILQDSFPVPRFPAFPTFPTFFSLPSHLVISFPPSPPLILRSHTLAPHH